jgi:hypothetical protein
MNVDERWNAELVVQMLSQPGVQYCNDSPGALDDGTVVRILTGLDKDKNVVGAYGLEKAMCPPFCYGTITKR